MGYDALASFLAGYLHQDWDVEFDSDTDVAIAFANREPVDAVVRTLGEGAVILEASTDDELSVWLVGAGCYFEPGGGATSSEWLRRFLRTVASAVATRGDE